MDGMKTCADVYDFFDIVRTTQQECCMAFSNMNDVKTFCDVAEDEGYESAHSVYDIVKSKDPTKIVLFARDHDKDMAWSRISEVRNGRWTDGVDFIDCYVARGDISSVDGGEYECAVDIKQLFYR